MHTDKTFFVNPTRTEAKVVDWSMAFFGASISAGRPVRLIVAAEQFHRTVDASAKAISLTDARRTVQLALTQVVDPELGG